MSKPLEGVRVLDLTTFVAAPVCCRLLADLGATVIKIEHPKGDAWRVTSRNYNPARFGDHMNPVFDIYNTGKQLISLNLKSPEGKEVFFKLLEQSDVFVTNTRPEALKRLGIHYEDVKDRFPGLIYAMVLGFGEKGPEAAVPAFDVTAFWARSGFLRDMALDNEAYEPLMPPSSAGDTVVGTTLCAEICAALLRKERTGSGDYVRVSLYQGGIFTFGTMSLATQQPSPRSYPRTRFAGGSAGGVTGTYRCSDGEWMFLSTGGADALYVPRVLRMVGHPELADDPRFLVPEEARKPENIRGIYTLARDAFLEMPRAHWLEQAKLFDVPVVKLNHFCEVAEDEQAIANGFMQKVTYENGDSIMMPASPIIMDSVGELTTQHMPTPGWDTQAVLEDLGYTPEQIEAMEAGGAIRTRQ